VTFESIWRFPLIQLSDGNQITVSQLALALGLLLVGLFLARRLERAIGRQLAVRGMNPDAVQTLQRVLFYGLVVVLVITALGALNIPITAMAFATGAIAIGVGFGAQAIINNFISGWILMSERPVRIGDFVEIDGANGTVERIGNRSTRIRRVDGVHLMVPNSKLLETTVINWTLVDHDIRTVVTVGVAYGSPVRRVEALLHEAVRHDRVKSEPPPMVVFEDFGDNALVFQVYFWCQVSGAMELRRTRSDIRFAIDDLFHKNGIVIAFPQRDLHFDADRPLTIRMERAQRDDR
jgi:small-conductance mechanosensitive channel